MGQFAGIANNVNLYYECSGQGTPLIFIPGWSMSTKFFAKQLAYFAECGDFKAVAYDPRSQGMSSKTDNGNNYSQRGHDLRAFMEELELKDAVLAGWSNGCYDAYSYVGQCGADNLKAFISIDMSPVGFGSGEHAWTSCNSLDELSAWYAPTQQKRKELIPGLIDWMLNRKPTEEELTWMRGEILRTPLEAANLLLLDSLFLDYTREARLINEKIPFMHFLRQDGSDKAIPWINRETPSASYEVFNDHLMFLTEPERFNRALMSFLS